MRRKEFDEDEVLSHAVKIFWERGYEATSMQVLEEGMGIGRQSLYASFGSKQALFESALGYYHHHVIIPNLDPMRTAKAPIKALEAYFRHRIDDIFDPSAIAGCLITNSVTEKALLDKRIRALTAESIAYMLESFTIAVSNARKAGEISRDKDPVLWGGVLLNCAQGLFVLSKVRPEKKVLKASIATLLEVLKA
jgi:TetR/AcrR family transcriptional repressor of nem operon